MMRDLETLREALASTQQRLAAKDARLRELELVLDALQAVNKDDGPSAAWNKTFTLIKSTLDFHVAIVLEPGANSFLCVAATDVDLIGAQWRRCLLFDRAAAGRGAVVPDISLLPEWREGERHVNEAGAVVVPVTAPGGNGLLILLGHGHGAYAPGDLSLVSRLSLVTSQVLTFGRQERLAQAVKDSELRREIAVKANEAKSQFFANMSHELRTPLNGVVTVANLLGRTRLDASQQEMVDLIRASGQTLEGLVNDVLDFAKIENNSLRLEARPFDLMSELSSTFDLFATRADEKGLTFQIYDERTSSPWYEGDSLRIRQVVSNLLSNALKFTSEGGVTLKLSATPEGEDWRICISVQDTGIGFAPDVSERLFDRFEQADNTITRLYGGTGLGLSISRELAKLMKGDVLGHGAPGEGARFDFTFVVPGAADPGTQESDTDPAALAPAELKVLLVEDNPNNQRIISMILAMINADVRLAENGHEACEVFESETFDVVLMDLQMPVMDGLTAIETIRAREKTMRLPRTPILAVSANAMIHQVHEAIAAGADAHIAKPVDPKGLLTRIMEACAASRIRAA
jgi:signal transduction histidine kinase/CheY-like chemotaxis protein